MLLQIISRRKRFLSHVTALNGAPDRKSTLCQMRLPILVLELPVARLTPKRDVLKRLDNEAI